MALYYRESGLTWNQYLQAQSFVGDITSQIQRSGQEITSSISAQTQSLIASTESMVRSFDYGFEQITGELTQLRAAFEYNMGLVLNQLSIQQQTLDGIVDQLDAIHNTLQHPLLTQARELSKIGMERVSKGLLQEGLEALLESAEKNKTDFIVQLQLGKLYLYGKSLTDDMIDLPRAKEHLLLAARYANSEISSIPDAAKFCAEAFLHAAISCYAQANENFISGDAEAAQALTQEALTLAQNAAQVYPELSEAFYTHAKIAALLGDSETATISLKTAILADRNYCFKAEADKDFDGIRESINTLFESLRQQAQEYATQQLQEVKSLLEDWVYRSQTAQQAQEKIRAALAKAESLLQQSDTYFDYLDTLIPLKGARKIFTEISRSFYGATTLSGHSGPVESVAFSPDGSMLASGSGDGTVKLWSVASRQEIATLSGHSSIQSVAFSPDGTRLASASYDHTVKLWGSPVISLKQKKATQEQAQRERRRLEEETHAAEKAQQRRHLEEEKRAEEAQRRRLEEEKRAAELRTYRIKNNLCLECGANLGFLARLIGQQYCKQHRR